MALSMEKWKGKVAVVTGASSGIGAALAKRLVEEGMQVVGMARRVELIEEMAIELSHRDGGGQLFAIKCDMTQEQEILDAFSWIAENLGPIHVLVNNAGCIRHGPLGDGDADLWRQVLDVNVLGLCIATREAVKSMKANEIDGHIVHMNSIGGHYVPNFPDTNVYTASKHAVTALAKALRAEFDRMGSKIKCSSISLGLVATDIFEVGNFNLAPDPTLPVLRVEDVVEAIIYILSTPPHVQVHELLIKAVNEAI